MKNYFMSFVKWCGKIEWTSKDAVMSKVDQDRIWALLSQNHYLILTWRSNHLSSYAIAAAHFLLGVWRWIRMGGRAPAPKFARYGHAAFNVERTDRPDVSEDFELVEAIGKGVIISPFDKVFNCKRAVLLEPTIPPHSWQSLADRGLDRLGAEYDFNFDLTQDKKLSCIELVHFMLKGDVDFDIKYEDLSHEIHMFQNRLDPQMYRDSKCFRVVYETK